MTGSPQPEDNSRADDAAFERDLEAVLALEPTERIAGLVELVDKLRDELRQEE